MCAPGACARLLSLGLPRSPGAAGCCPPSRVIVVVGVLGGRVVGSSWAPSWRSCSIMSCVCVACVVFLVRHVFGRCGAACVCTSCCVLLHVRVYHIRGGRMAYLLPLASALASMSRGFCPSPVVELVGLGAVLPLCCATYSRPWGRSAMWNSCGTQGRRRWCAASCHAVVGCATLFSENFAVGCVALRRVTCRCVVLCGIEFGCVVSYGCVIVVCRGALCVLLCGVGWCCVLSGCVMSRCVLFCGGLLCGVVLCCVVWCCVVVCWVVVFFGLCCCPVSLVVVVCRLAARCVVVLLCGVLWRGASCLVVSWVWYVVVSGIGLWYVAVFALRAVVWRCSVSWQVALRVGTWWVCCCVARFFSLRFWCVARFVPLHCDVVFGIVFCRVALGYAMLCRVVPCHVVWCGGVSCGGSL